MLALIAAGPTDDQAARGLGISARTARKHLEGVFAKADVPRRAAAVAWGLRQARRPGPVLRVDENRTAPVLPGVPGRRTRASPPHPHLSRLARHDAEFDRLGRELDQPARGYAVMQRAAVDEVVGHADQAVHTQQAIAGWPTSVTPCAAAASRSAPSRVRAVRPWGSRSGRAHRC